jgi:hypothetical protein
VEALKPVVAGPEHYRYHWTRSVRRRRVAEVAVEHCAPAALAPTAAPGAAVGLALRDFPKLCDAGSEVVSLVPKRRRAAEWHSAVQDQTYRRPLKLVYATNGMPIRKGLRPTQADE